MYAKSLKCSACGKEYPLDLHYTCENCNGILMVDYDYDKMKDNLALTIFSTPKANLWHYKDLLPVNDEKNIISMNEGMTPLLQNLKNLKTKYNLKSIYIKDETRNPTASFKDRPTSVGISKALELGYKIVTIASTGNGAAATAGYAAKAGVKSYIFVPENTPVSKINQVLTYGAEIVKVKGVYSNSYKLALEASKKFNWANLTSTYLNPYTLEGDKTVAYELFYQMEGEVPDYIFVPIGAGPLLYGIFKGFKELNILGLCNKIPAMVGVQAENCSPIITAYKQNKKYVVAWEKADTIASGIADPLIGYDQDGTMTLDAIYKTNGIGVAVSEDELINAVYELGSQEGIFAEPAAAAAWAGYKKLLKDEKITRNDKVVLMITGHGLKQSIASNFNYNKIPIIESLEQLKSNLNLQ
ncbi:MAG: threonine synthase [Atribacterota bacterium]